jgi:adenylate kinase
MRLVLLGPPGSGKGTQSALLAERLGVPHISTGDMLRAAVAAGTELGSKAAAHMEAGELVPDDLVVLIVRERLSQPDANEGFLLDGFPRTDVQAEKLGGMLEEISSGLDAVVLIDVPEEDILRRLSGRRVCLACGAVYHIDSNPPPEHRRCPEGGECSFVQRHDDTEAVIKERLRIYREQTSPLINYYKSRGLLVSVDGVGSVREVFDRIVRTL